MGWLEMLECLSNVGKLFRVIRGWHIRTVLPQPSTKSKGKKLNGWRPTAPNMAKWRRVLTLPKCWQRNHLVKKYGSNCYLCGKPFRSAKEITFDYWERLSKGGADTLENYRLAHDSCNSLKANLSLEEFGEFQKGAIKWED